MEAVDSMRRIQWRRRGIWRWYERYFVNLRARENSTDVECQYRDEAEVVGFGVLLSLLGHV